MASSGTWTTAYAAALADPADTLPSCRSRRASAARRSAR